MINVYRKISGVETVVCTISDKDATDKTAIMGAYEVPVSVIVDEILSIRDGDYIKLNGINYTLNREPEYTIESEVKYSYDLVFEHPFYVLLNKMYCNRITGYTTFTLTGKLRDFVELLVWCVNISAENPDGVDTGWTIGDIIDTDYMNLQFTDLFCNEVLNMLADKFQVEYFFNNKQINFVERIEQLTDHVFEQGAGKGLYKLTQQNVDKEDTVTRLLVRGGNQNVPIAYADEEGYLKLPENYLENFSEHSKVVEKKKKFEEEFPKFVGTVATVSGENNKILTCPQIDFDVAAIAVGDNARINFLTGDLMGGPGYKFKWNNANKQITLVEQDDETALPDADGNKPKIPNSTKKAKVGDTFNFTGVLMPESYVTASINRLRAKGTKYLNLYSKKRVKFTLDINHRYLRNKPALKVGDLVVISIPQKSFSQVIRITQLERNLHTGAISATVSNYLEENWEKYVSDKVDEVRNEILAKQVNVRNTLEAIFKDGIITESELKIIESVLDRLYIERGQMNAQYLVVRGNINLVNKVPLTNAWDAYQASYINVRDAINSAIADGEITEAEKIDIDNKISTYSTQLNGFSSALEQAREDIENYKNQAILDVTQDNINYLQQQIDGEVSNWFYPYSPTLSNYPASDWTTSTEKDRHIGDTFTNTQPSPAADAGKSWRFVKNGSTYSWTQIADSDAVKALQQAAQAQATADGKSTTFLVQPTKYHLGDTWVLNADRTINGTAYKQGEILTATQDSTTFVEAHWIKRVRYTDDTAVDNLQIGGRNLLLNTANGFYLTGSDRPDGRTHEILPNKNGLITVIDNVSLSAYGWATPSNSVIDFSERDVWYTWSLDVKTNNDSFVIGTNLRLNTTSVVPGSYANIPNTNGEWRRVSVSIYVPSGITEINRMWINIGGANTIGATLEYKPTFKVEKGNKDTGYDRAPEDVQAEIDEAKQAGIDAQKAVETTNTNVTDLNDYVDGAFKDGVVSESEAKAIEKYINIVNADKDAHDATYNKLYTNTYLEGAAKTNLLNSKISYNGAIDNLLSAINAAIADGKVTPAEKNTVDTRYSEYRSALSTFNTRIEEANKAIQDKLDSLSTQKVNDLQIGGTNLIPKSRGTELGNYANGGLYAMGGYTLSIYGGDSFRIASTGVPDPPDNQNNIRIATGKTLQLNETYTLSFEAMTSSSSDRNHNIRMPYSSDNIVSIKTGDWQKYFFTFKITNENTVNGQNNYFFFWQQNQGIYVTYLRKVKLEKGNKPTDWDEAQEDVQGRIDSAKQEALTAAGAAQSSANAAQNAANSLKDFSDAAFADGVINRAERAAIEKYKNSVNETKLTVDSGYTQVYNNTYLEGTPKTNLLNAKNAVNTAYTNLINSIDTAIADNITTPAEKADVDAKFGLFNTALATYQVRLEEANKAIQAKLDAISKGYVDNLQIGGKNLIRGTNTFNGYNSYQGSSVVKTPNFHVEEWKASDATRFQVSGGTETIKLLKSFGELSAANRPDPNPKYVLSVYIKNLGATDVRFFANPSTVGSVTVVPSEAVRAIIYYDTDSRNVMQFQFRGVNADTGFDIALWHDQIEEGNKVSAWSRSDYDVKAEIDNAAQIAADAQAKANISKAITDKFGTTVDGGLIGTVMILLRELNSSQETAGLSGIQGALMNNPAFWAGGTSAKALALIQFLSKMSAGTTPGEDEYGNLAKITMLHDGAAKIGDFIIEKTGRIVMVDPATGKIRLQFGVQNIPLISTLMGENNPSGGPITIGSGSTGTSQILTGSIDVTHSGATATFGGTTMNISATGQKPSNAPYSTVEATLWLRKNGIRYWPLAVADLAFTEEDNLFKSRQVIASPSTIPLGSPGVYTFELVIVKSGLVGGEYTTTTSSTFSWIFTVANVRRQEYGLDGMMFFYSNHHFHFTEGGGLDGRAAANKWNMPGVLLSASVGSNGTFSNWWGAKKHATQTAIKNSTGRYTVYHSIGHENYQVTASPNASNRSYHIVSRGVDNFVIEWRSILGAQPLTDTIFDFQITGNNYM